MAKEDVEIANLRPEDTGINDIVLCISTRQGSHDARVKVFPPNKLGVDSLAYVLTVENESKVVIQPKESWLSSKEGTQVLGQVKFWIWKNRTELLRLWDLNPAKVPYDVITDLICNLEKV